MNWLDTERGCIISSVLSHGWYRILVGTLRSLRRPQCLICRINVMMWRKTLTASFTIRPPNTICVCVCVSTDLKLPSLVTATTVQWYMNFFTGIPLQKNHHLVPYNRQKETFRSVDGVLRVLSASVHGAHRLPPPTSLITDRITAGLYHRSLVAWIWTCDKKCRFWMRNAAHVGHSIQFRNLLCTMSFAKCWGIHTEPNCTS